MPRPYLQPVFWLLQKMGALLLTFFLLPVVYADVEVNLKHNVSRNTYVNGQEIIVNLEHDFSANGRLTWHWQDYKGRLLSQPQLFEEGGNTQIGTPEGVLPSYLGLVVTPISKSITIAGREPGEAKEYGFAVLQPVPEKKSPADMDHWMGMVHAKRDDPWLLGWIKTLTWRTTSARWWGNAMEERRAAGHNELPIISGGDWKSDDYKPVSAAQLRRMAKRARDYFAADKNTVYWETGIEENLGGRFKRPYYFPNLTAKAAAIREAADEANPDIKLIFQIANINVEHVGQFMASDASANYDILSLHPYKWPDFPDPETWLADYLADVRAEMRKHGRELPIWVTEIGAPHRGNCEDCFFGYPKDNKEVPGLSDEEMITFMIKFHMLALDQGVEKIFWYNYKDRGESRDFAEDHFGLISHWEFPKPAYVAYINLNRSLIDKSLTSRIHKGDLWAFEFADEANKTVVAWSFPDDSMVVSPADLGLADYAAEQLRVTDALGDPIELEQSEIALGREPIFIHAPLEAR